MSYPFQNKFNNDAPMYGEESHLEIIAPAIEIDNVMQLIGEKIPYDANVTQPANQDLDNEDIPQVVKFINNTESDYTVNDDGSVIVKDTKGILEFSCGDYLAINATAPDFLINDILETDSHGILGGASMAFKTFADLRLVYSICTGKDFMGHEVYKTGKVLYICGEGKGALARRLKALQIVESDFNGNLLVLETNISIDVKDDMERLKIAIAKIDPVLVVFDTFASLVSETDENAPCQVAKALRLIKETCRNGHTSSLIIHHYGKDASRGLRGASNFVNDVDFAIEMTRNADSMITTMSCKKQKDGENFQDIHMEAFVVELGLARQDGKATTSLVLKQSGYVPEKKSAKKLSQNSQIALSKLRDVINHAPVTLVTHLPEVIKDMFKEHADQAPSKFVTFDQWRDAAIESITVNSDCSDSKKYNAAKRNAWRIVRDQLYASGHIGFVGDYAWIAYDKNIA